jgi:HSP20 family molecular chaperone IbpA
MNINKLFIAALLVCGAGTANADYSTYPYQGNYYYESSNTDYSYPYNGDSLQSSDIRVDSTITPYYNNFQRTNLNSNISNDGQYFDSTRATSDGRFYMNERNVQDYNRYNQTSPSNSNIYRNNTSFTDRDTTSDYRSNYNTNSKNYDVSEDDRTLAKKIQATLTGEMGKNVTVDVDNGIVTLRGNVRGQSDKMQIEQKAKNVAGVKGVNNQIEIK